MANSAFNRVLVVLRWFCPEHLLEEIEGDLAQQYERDKNRFGDRRAKRRMIWNALRFFRPGIVLRNSLAFNLLNASMLYNYLLVIIRNIRRTPLLTATNVLSLSIGLAACLIIALFTADELKFDSFHSQRTSIYRAYGQPHYAGAGVQNVALTMGWLGPQMAAELPEVTSFSRFWNTGKAVFKSGEAQFLIDQVAAVDSTFLDIFDFELLAGNRETTLDEPNRVVITEEVALKFFDSPDAALHKQITIQETEFMVTGVLRNVPEHSHLQFDALQSISTFARTNRMFKQSWDGSFLYTYVLLQPGSNIKQLENKLADLWIRHTGIKDEAKTTTLRLQSLRDVHLDSSEMEHDYSNYRRFNGTYLGVFTAVGVFILIIAAVNFMNLTTARSTVRWKEMGIRKTTGARSNQLFGQLVLESTILAFGSLLIAYAFAAVSLPALNQLLHRQISFSSLILQPNLVIISLLAALVLGILTGIYPALRMSSQHVTSLLKGLAPGDRRSVFRNAMVVVQFGLALAMVESTLIVVQQLSYIKTRDIGFSKDQIMIIDMNSEVNRKFEFLKAEWLRSQFVLGVTASSQRIGGNFNGWGFKVRTDSGVHQFTPSNVNVDFDYLNVYGIKLREGRTFSPKVPADRGKSFIVNETMVRELGLASPLGAGAGHSWYENDSLGTIIGVAKDFNFNSLHHQIGALALVCHPEWGYEEISIKIDGTHVQEAISAIKSLYEANISSYPFAYSFLDDHMAQLYRSDEQLQSVVGVMAVLAILIACMGLFALTAIAVGKRTKEIAIRKVMGATEFQLAAFLSSDFVRLILAAFVLTTPLSWYILGSWLENFAFRISISPFVMALGGTIALIIGMLTIGYHTVTLARTNPVKSLKAE